jgi:hypothetical protein
MELALHLAKKPAERLNPECSYCGKRGHWDDTCWRLHPELRLSRGRNHNQGGVGGELGVECGYGRHNV